jgi:hypothetical protein
LQNQFAVNLLEFLFTIFAILISFLFFYLAYINFDLKNYWLGYIIAIYFAIYFIPDLPKVIKNFYVVELGIVGDKGFCIIECNSKNKWNLKKTILFKEHFQMNVYQEQSYMLTGRCRNILHRVYDIKDIKGKKVFSKSINHCTKEDYKEDINYQFLEHMWSAFRRFKYN